ncbi:MAG: nicotinate-nucleotide adenylyltransferase [Bacteroidia bacterium]|nr:nicotinate-nucleotide adenylyltransferase [Bacteroidia bacterium]
MKIGLFFGSFNPIHVGHLIIAQSALNETELQEIWFMVSPQNPFKKKASLLGEVDRLRMVEMAVEGNFKLRASNFEFFLEKPSYTIDTLTALRERYPKHEFSIIMGEDNLQHFSKWKNYEAILNYYKVYVYPRLGSDGSSFDQYPQVIQFNMPFLDISATRIRELLAAKKSVRYLVPDAVWKYLDEQNFYAN